MPLAFAGSYFLLSQALRLFLALVFPPPVSISFTEWLRVFLVGVHFDLVIALILFIPLMLWTSLVSTEKWQAMWHRGLLTVLSIIGWFVLTFMLIAEGFFFEEFQSRYNTVAIDYLIYPHEVFVNIWETYPVPAVVVGVLVIATLIVRTGWVLTKRLEADRLPVRAPKLAWVWLLVAVVGGFTIRIEEARFSRERTVNEMANNTFVSVLTAAFTRNLDYPHFYPTMDRDEAYARARKLVATPDSKFTGPPDSLQRQIGGDANAPKRNLVLLLEESLGSEFWGCLGRKEPSLTPLMDNIATNQALLFDNIYADGNRTIRGYEGVFSSFPPLPGDSIVARDRSDNVETIARVLGRDGYDTTFVYAGRGVFDGTGPFTKANGWSNFVELKDFKNPVFTTVWGVCNEDLYDRLLEECRDRHKRGLPFFMTSMSVSNHKPFTYPTGRIPDNPNEKRRDFVVKYSDYALNRFFQMAQKEAFWTNTIFAVVADHGARVYGSQTIPIHSYEIPMVVVGPTVVSQPKRISTLGCQLDVAPTLIGLIGRPYESSFFGHDLLKWPDRKGLCLLNHNRSVGIYSDDRLVTFSLNKKIEYFSGNPKQTTMQRVMQPDARHEELVKDATALYQVADELYMNRRYRILPPTEQGVTAHQPDKESVAVGEKRKTP